MDPPALLRWFHGNARDLPWRVEPRDPYRVWVSEVMLQQTRVETVLRYFEPFLRAFPDARSLADADDDRLMKRWEGLGYYRRARNLREGARIVVAEHGGEVPRTAAALAELPGVGAYTAGAIASLAFGERAAAVDGNVTRVMARRTASRSASRADVEAWVMRYQPASAPGPFNEALMELGATVCTPRAPRCDACPVAGSCAGRRDPERFPASKERAKARRVKVALAVMKRGDRFLLERRESGLLAGTWGLPWVEGGREALASHVQRLVGARVEVGKRVASGEHAFTHRTWSMTAYEVETEGRAGAWRRPEDVALGTAHRKILASGVSNPRRGPSSPSPRRSP